jgi:hypothetical protein
MTGAQGPVGPTGPTGPQGNVGPAGAQGTAGLNSFTLSSADFTVPPVGQTVVTTLTDATWVTVGQMVAIQGAGGTNAGSLRCTNKTGNQVTLLNEGAGIAPLADATQDGLLRKVSGLATDFVDGTNNCQPLQPVIWSVRRLTFNALGNSTFEIDQRTAGAGVTMGAGTWAQDRWGANKTAAAAMQSTARQIDASASPILLPGTNFAITSKFLRVTLTTAQAALAAADLLYLNQTIEGICLRELISDVHSVSLLVRSSVANLSFGMALRDTAAARSLTKLCSIPTAGVWTLIPLANLPIWAPASTWSLAPGAAGYTLSIGLAVGSTYTAPANDTWQNGNFVAALGQSNFAASPVNSTFDIAMIQHEPGAQCSPFIDCSFGQNLDGDMGCLRYFCKSYPYFLAPGAVNQNPRVAGYTSAAFLTTVAFSECFPKRMAKAPTPTIYSDYTGAINAARDQVGGVDRGVTVASPLISERGMSQFAMASGTAAASLVTFHYTADTGW